MRILLLVVLTLLNIEPAVAIAPAESPERFYRVGGGLGYSFAGYRDEIESPINRYFNAFTFIHDASIEKGNLLHSLNINFFIGHPQMTTPYKGYSHKKFIALRGSTEYAIDYRLWGNETFPGYLGGAFRAIIYYSGTDGTEEEDVPVPTGYGLVSLDIHATQKWLINAKHTLAFSAVYPVFGYAVRPPYAGFDELWLKYLYESPIKIVTLGKIISFHNYWAVCGDLKYQYKYNELLSPYAGLGFELSRINFPQPRIDTLFRFSTGIAFTF